MLEGKATHSARQPALAGHTLADKPLKNAGVATLSESTTQETTVPVAAPRSVPGETAFTGSLMSCRSFLDAIGIRQLETCPIILASDTELSTARQLAEATLSLADKPICNASVEIPMAAMERQAAHPAAHPT
mmetsp:Transcript_17145/g.36810  ORF Transcript_17145/g.36810 Transcript_17145/m.36810 type:complete len:132 (-) Transcript_17145:1553-1948(-)